MYGSANVIRHREDVDLRQLSRLHASVVGITHNYLYMSLAMSQNLLLVCTPYETSEENEQEAVSSIFGVWLPITPIS
jgi:hypothetical protein